MGEPTASRPHMPGYGIVGPLEGKGLLSWEWAEERLVSSHDYWLATTRPAGSPHVMPVWGVWAQGAAWFSSSRESRKARNIAADPRVVLTTDNPRQPVVVEGVVEPVWRGQGHRGIHHLGQHEVPDRPGRGLLRRERVLPARASMGLRSRRRRFHRFPHPLGLWERALTGESPVGERSARLGDDHVAG